ncbi:MAG: DNA repair protein RadC [Hyphomicrobiaceae bacterium]|nr:MAG: DNA repair protein RadC [Hyphomicrobiaceae bacterium]
MHHGLETITIREVALTYPRHVERLKRVFCASSAASIVREIVNNRPQEHLVVLHLDIKHHVVSYSIAGIGTVCSCLAHPREVFGPALRANASSIILAHNHPSGCVSPSSNDYTVTQRIKEAGEILGVQLVDSLIVTDTDHYSMMR